MFVGRLLVFARDSFCKSPNPTPSLTSLGVYTFLLAYASLFTQCVFFSLEITFVAVSFSKFYVERTHITRNGRLCQGPCKLTTSWVTFSSGMLSSSVWKCCSNFLVIFFATFFETDYPEVIVQDSTFCCSLADLPSCHSVP